MNTDPYFDRQRTPTYECFDFVREVWLSEFGEDIGDKLRGLVASISGNSHRVNLSEVKLFKRLQVPIDPCFVILQRGRTVPHSGIYYQGSVFHLAGNSPQFQPLSVVSRCYPRVSFYR